MKPLSIKLCFLFLLPFLLISPVLSHEPGVSPNRDFKEIKRARLKKLDSIRNCISRSANIEELSSCKQKRKSSKGINQKK